MPEDVLHGTQDSNENATHRLHGGENPKPQQFEGMQS
jgi:hypothetical protein